MSSNPELNIHDYFGPRNGRTITPVRDVNYSPSYLSNTLSYRQADQIRDTFLDNYSGPLPLNILILGAGIGSLSFSFLDSNKVGQVVSIESKPNLIPLLQRNSLEYGYPTFDPNNPNAYLKHLVWATNPGGMSNVLEQNAASLNLYSMFLIADPNSSSVDGTLIPLWIKNFAKRVNTFAVWSDTRIVIPSTIPITDLDRVDYNLFSKYHLTLLFPKITRPDEIIITDDWTNKLKLTLESILRRIPGIREETIPKFIVPDALQMWTPAFVHETFDLNRNNNYEVLEFLGDRVIETQFSIYLMKRFPSAGPSELTEVKSKYMSEDYQPRISDELGISSLIKVRGTNVTNKMKEDVFESFVGALYKVTETYVDTFKAGNVVFNFIKMIFDNIPIDVTSSNAKPKTLLKEMMEALGVDYVEERTNYDRAGAAYYQVALTPAAMEYFTMEGIEFASPILGSSSKRTKNESLDDAYMQALEKIRAAGLTQEWLDHKRSDRKNLDDVDLEPYMKNFRDRLAREGYESHKIEVSRLSSTNNRKTLILVGYKTNKQGLKESYNLIVRSSSNLKDAKQILVRDYANGSN
ncbi:Ribonuclease III [Orpheovirus IHUMI-LCC2]|uniref:Ribonuclease III n=1 Tax=Orpheovirus IHUMI-LCC2 TaxID=2023057 RepID=A0A2I2L5V4_9VIRU|nr:Ribonuclease III [Orpheovirus IHUMI-LCC2]SNW62896.1 Ribonuclease III [Orpheovirus IHUMI-LCC2]